MQAPQTFHRVFEVWNFFCSYFNGCLRLCIIV